MSSDKGYIKIHREILDSEVFANRSDLKIWLWLLCKASYKIRYKEVKVGKGYTTVKLEEGDLLFGRGKAEEALGLDGSLIYRTLQKFEDNGMIFLKVNNQYTVISIANWEEYQGENELDMNEIRTPNEHKQESKESMKKEEKKDKKGAPACVRDFEEFSKTFSEKFVTIKDIVFPEWIETSPLLKERLIFYLFEFRSKTNRKLKSTGLAITRIIKRMEEDCGKCPDIALSNIEYSITKSYDMIYPEPVRNTVKSQEIKPFDIVDYAKDNLDKLAESPAGPYSWKNTLVAVLQKEYKCNITEFVDQNLESLKAITDIIEFATEIKTAIKNEVKS